MNKETLREMAGEEITSFPRDYRCHEGARVIGEKLKSVGVNVEIKDGGVIYDTSFFLRENYDFLSFLSSEYFIAEARKELGGEGAKSKIHVLHSWCEVRSDTGGIIVIDWHANLSLSSTCGVGNSLIVEDKSDLPHRYIPMGIAIGRWIVFLTFPPYVTKVRF